MKSYSSGMDHTFVIRPTTMFVALFLFCHLNIVSGQILPIVNPQVDGGLRSNVNPNLWYSKERKQIYREINFINDLPSRSNQLVDSEVDAEHEEDMRHHVHYMMASTAEQPDSGGRSSNLNIWLTILIAALAAAILS